MPPSTLARPPRVLVGTLHTDENEFTRCRESIGAQHGVVIEHFVLSDVAEIEAHRRLYEYFENNAAEFELFVKVDADMILARPTVLAEISERFRELPSIEQITVPVHDFFTDMYIDGLQSFRSSVRWPTRDEIFTDVSPVPSHARIVDHALEPAALHCADPSPLQAVRYGIHRGAKIVAACSRTIDQWSIAHLTSVAATWAHYLARRDRRMLLASLCAEMAIGGHYGSPARCLALEYMVRICDEMAQVSTEELDRRCRAVRLRNFAWLKPHWRRDMVRGGVLGLIRGRIAAFWRRMKKPSGVLPNEGGDIE